MNARFAAVALTSGLSVMLVSQLFPVPTAMSLMDANKHRPATTSARKALLMAHVTQLAPALQANATPQADIAPRLVPPPMIDVPRPAAAADAAPAPSAEAVRDVQALRAPEIASAPAVPAETAPELTPPPSTAAPHEAAAADEWRAPDQPGSFQVASVDPTEMVPSETLSRPDAPALVQEATSQEQKSQEAESLELKSLELKSLELKSLELKSLEPTPEMALRDERRAGVNAFEVVDECFVVDICVDRYLWALYQRAPKEDKMTVSEQRAVTVKRKHKLVTVMRTFTKLVDENFAWKDVAASGKAGLSMQDYVIGGMDRSFKLKLFHVLHAAEDAGLSPGITSAFRDDYRQTIASGLKAASNRSYHGGSLRGGYGHGLAADIISVKGTTRAERWAATEVLWKWIDDHGKEFGVGRPYLSYDPPHVGPTDGEEYVSRRGPAVRQAMAELKPRKHAAGRREHGAGKHARAAKSHPVRSTRVASRAM